MIRKNRLAYNLAIIKPLRSKAKEDKREEERQNKDKGESESSTREYAQWRTGNSSRYTMSHIFGKVTRSCPTDKFATFKKEIDMMEKRRWKKRMKNLNSLKQ